MLAKNPFAGNLTKMLLLVQVFLFGEDTCTRTNVADISYTPTKGFAGIFNHIAISVKLQ